MNHAPLLGRLLLRLMVPRADHDFVAGDLLEEFHECVVPRVGARAARRWFMAQVVRSVVPFVRLRIRRTHPGAELLRAQMLVAFPLLLFHLLWTFVLSQVPLRADTLSPGFAAGTALCLITIVAAGSWAAGVRFGSATGRSPFTLTGAVFVVTALLTSPPAISRFASPSLLAIALPMAVLAGALFRTLFQPLDRAGRTS